MLIAFIAQLLVLLLLIWFYTKERKRSDTLQDENTSLKLERGGMEEKIKALEEAKDTFRALSSEALEKNNTAFLQLAQQVMEKHHEKSKGVLDKKEQSILDLFKPVKDTLARLDTGMKNLEGERKVDQATLKKQLQHMIETERDLRKETSILVKALRTPIARGQWGEIQLKRVVELAGMVKQCDFVEQTSVTGGEGRLRPDLIVKLPGNKQIIIDAKTPFEAYFDSLSTDDPEEKQRKLQTHARHVRQHIQALGKKAYWEQFDHTPEFVILFLPSEAFFSAAVEYDPSLIEIGVDHGVVLATPTTLIGLLRVIAYGWKQESLSEHAHQISLLGEELYKRITDMSSHWHKVGKSLTSSIESYNKAVGSLETRVLVTARKFQTLGIGSETTPLPTHLVEQIARPLTATEMTDE
ncbi:MAG: DNA recombination protein RmuC [Simkaniaceae bacterium]|nr:DNA recombination protein RmuC [Simkaniaceae bacterium]